MKKNRWATLCRLLKWSLPFYAFLLFSLTGIGGSIATTHGMSSLRFPTQFPHPFDTPTPTPTPTSTPVTATSTPTYTPTPTSTPVPTPIPTPVPTATQPPIAILPPQIQPTPSGAMFPIQIVATETPATATPTSTPASATPAASTATAGKTMATKITLTNQPLQNLGDGEEILSTFMLPLSVGAPLLLASGGMLFWLVRRRHYKPALQGASQVAQAALWMSSRELDSDLNALHYVTGASGALPVPVRTQTPYRPTPTSQLPFTQPTYTPMELSAITAAFPQQMLTISSSNKADRYLQEDDLLPLPMDALNPPLQLIEARESNKHMQMFPLAVPPIALINTHISSISSPSLMPPVVSLPIRPPSTKEDLLLGEVMRQAQMGLFVVLGREKRLTNPHTNH